MSLSNIPASLSELAFTDYHLELEAPHSDSSAQKTIVPRYVAEARGGLDWGAARDVDADTPIRYSQLSKLPTEMFENHGRLRAEILKVRKNRGEAISKTTKRPRWYDSAITFDGMRLRLTVTKVTTQALHVAVRRISLEIPPISELRLHPDVEHSLSTIAENLEYPSGLILVTGATGAGKTTTATSTFSHYVRSTGTVGYTVEDPCELLLQGFHGDGFVYQTEAEDQGGWAQGIRTALRTRPSILFLGEILDEEIARQALRAAGSGHLVISTLHAGGVRDTFDVMTRLCGGAASRDIREQIAQHTQLIIHQRRVGNRIDCQLCDLRNKESKQRIRSLMGENNTQPIEEESWTDKLDGQTLTDDDGL